MNTINKLNMIKSVITEICLDIKCMIINYITCVKTLVILFLHTELLHVPVSYSATITGILRYIEFDNSRSRKHFW